MIAIVGGIGSGKSTLAQAILGEVIKESGHVCTAGNISYMAQTSWIRNDTISGNITLGQSPHLFDEEKYNRILDISQLTADIQVLEGKDMTEIGAKGINLSGGQKQRLSIARAIYFGAHIYIIDDSLSALDPQVAHKVFHQVILGEMTSSTRIFITHALHFLSNPNIDKSIYIYIYIYIYI